MDDDDSNAVMAFLASTAAFNGFLNEVTGAEAASRPIEDEEECGGQILDGFSPRNRYLINSLILLYAMLSSGGKLSIEYHLPATVSGFFFPSFLTFSMVNLIFGLTLHCITKISVWYIF
jgi:hypothetical protein